MPRASAGPRWPQALDALWLLVYAGLFVTHSSTQPPPAWAYALLALLGWVGSALFDRGAWRDAWSRLGWCGVALLAFMVCVVVSEWLWATVQVPGKWRYMGAQLGLIACLPVLVRVLRQRAWAWQVLLVAVGLVCLFHWVAMPLEALYGTKFSLSEAPQIPRPMGLLNYQATGLTAHPSFYAGFYLPVFYLGWGLVQEHRLTASWWQPSRGFMGALCLLWFLPTACSQSRSALLGAGLASLWLLGWHLWQARARASLWWLLLVLAGTTWLGYAWLFREGSKSGAGLRWAYLAMYLDAVWHWPQVFTGHGLLSDRSTLVASGQVLISHSHNDLVETWYSWGLGALLAYLAFWWGLLKKIGESFLRRGAGWPLAALLSVWPSMLTDLGFQHLEKAFFVVLLTAVVVALPPREDGGRATGGVPLSRG